MFAAGDCGKLLKLLPTEALRGVIDANRDDIFDRAAALLDAALRNSA